MLWESAPLPAVERALKDLRIVSAVFDPTGNVPDEGDYIAVTGRNAGELERVATGLSAAGDARPEVARNMLDALRRWRADSDVAFANPQNSDELRGKLKALGQLE